MVCTFIIAADIVLTVARRRFLLKYETRDEVKILKRGGGGVVDIRETIVQYDEQSPLYGFVHYRRRKVILKYVPQRTSRLLQGRSKRCPHIVFILLTCFSSSIGSFPSRHGAFHPARYCFLLHHPQGPQRRRTLFCMLASHCFRVHQIIKRLLASTRPLRNRRGCQ